MEALLAITEYRRAKQIAYNEKHGITPRSVQRAVQESLHTILRAREVEESVVREGGGDFSLTETLRELEQEMVIAAANLEYEKAALLRDQIAELKAGTGVSKIEPKQRPVSYGGEKTKRTKTRAEGERRQDRGRVRKGDEKRKRHHEERRHEQIRNAAVRPPP